MIEFIQAETRQTCNTIKQVSVSSLRLILVRFGEVSLNELILRVGRLVLADRDLKQARLGQVCSRFARVG